MKTYQHFLLLQSPYQSLYFCQIGRKERERQKKARHSVVNAGLIILITSVLFYIREPLFLSVPPRVLSSQSPQSLFLHKLLGSSELVSHHAQELLALLQYIQINQRNLHQRVV